MKVEYYSNVGNKPKFDEIEILNLPPGYVFNIEWVGARLARTYRNVGTSPYSVLDHSLAVGDLVAAAEPQCAELQLWALLHDATEALIGDIPGPFKDFVPEIRKVEFRIMRNLMRSLWPTRIKAKQLAALQAACHKYDVQAYGLERSLQLEAPVNALEIFLDKYRTLCETILKEKKK